MPEHARHGLDGALEGAAAVGNRIKKRKKFCSAGSEDAATWTVDNGLLESGGLGALVGDPGRGTALAVLLWGHPVVAGDAAPRVAARLPAVDARRHPLAHGHAALMVRRG